MAAGGAQGRAVGLTAGVVAVLGGVLGGVIWWATGQGDRPPGLEPAIGASSGVVSAPDAGADPVAPLLVPEPPRFDVVRVESGGLATVAGQAPAGAVVSLRLDGGEVAQGMADATGQFAILVTLPPSDAPRMLGLLAILPDGAELAGVETVAIGPVVAAVEAPVEAAAEAGGEPAPPQALLLSEAGATVMQAPEAVEAVAGEAAAVAVSIDAISYGPAGEVMVSGRANPGAALRLYLDDGAAGDLVADAGGRWQTRLAEVVPGLHRLRLDEVDAAGKVLSRFETPFQREVPQVAALAPAEAAPVAGPAPIIITVQPGLTLWAIARENFGDGVMYVQVFEANRDKIKDPDLIYPGQVFTVPKP